jgi:hypothetical protein
MWRWKIEEEEEEEEEEETLSNDWNRHFVECSCCPVFIANNLP